MNYVYNIEDQYTAFGNFIPKGTKHTEPSYPVGEHGYVVTEGPAFYKVNKKGSNYPFAPTNIHTAYDPFNVKECQECPKANDFTRYRKDFLLLNNLQGTKDFYNFNK